MSKKLTPAQIVAAQKKAGMGGSLGTAPATAKKAQAKAPASSGPSLQAIADAFGGGDKAQAFTAAQSTTADPIDPIYASQVGNNNQAGGDNDAGYISGRNQGLTNLGYSFTQDPADSFKVTGLTYDPTNPFSQATQLREHYRNAQRGDTNNLAARGQLYSGALQNQLGYDTEDFNRGDNSILTQANGLVSGAIQNHRTNLTNIGGLNIGALGDSIGRQKPSDVPAADPMIAPSVGGALYGPKAAAKPKALVKKSKPVYGKPVGKSSAAGFTKF